MSGFAPAFPLGGPDIRPNCLPASFDAAMSIECCILPLPNIERLKLGNRWGAYSASQAFRLNLCHSSDRISLLSNGDLHPECTQRLISINVWEGALLVFVPIEKIFSEA